MQKSQRQYGWAMTVLLAVVTELSFAGQNTIEIGGANTVKGSRKVINDTRVLSKFDVIQVDAGIDVNVDLGRKQKCVVRGDDNIVPLVSTEVIGRTLRIAIDANYATMDEFAVYIDLPELRELIVNGSGDVTINRLSQDAFTVSINGSGDVSATGKVKNLFAEINGSGDLELEALRTTNTEITVTGSGDANLEVADSLKARVSGSGDVWYTGFPGKVDKKITGSGSVEPGVPTSRDE